MRRLFLYLFLSFIFISTSFADLNTETDYTLIDCINGDDATAVSFDKDKPYQTLKGGIESTITYINENINKPGNEATASGLVFNVKIECSMNDILNQRIDLNFNGKKYNNELLIQGINDNSFIIDDNYFYLFNNVTSYITFKKVNFVNNSKYGYYFTTDKAKDFLYSYPSILYYGIKLEDTYIKLKKNTQIGARNTYRYSTKSMGRYGWNYRGPYILPLNINYFNINNSIIDIDVEKDYSFDMPKITRNSKINFKSIDGSGSYFKPDFPSNILFREEGIVGNSLDTAFSAMISNEIDMGGNNFGSENVDNIFIINNKFSNFNDFTLSDNPLYINNLIENKSNIDISGSKDLYNNIFKSSYTDTYDEYNLRRNFTISDISSGGLGWIFKRLNNDKYLNLDLSSVSLYKEITGNDLVNGLGEIYVIFKY